MKRTAAITASLLIGLTLTACGTTKSTAQLESKTATSTNHVTKPKVKPKFTGPLPGDLMIADRGNDRIIIVTPQKKILWEKSFAYLGGSHDVNALGPDDAFFTPDHKHIIINEEDDHAIALIDVLTKKQVWSYGHIGIPGSAPGYLNTPDDAYQLPSGIITTADIHNQRILFINPKTNKVVKQYGQTGVRYHNPPTSFAAPNGDTPLPDGGILITEIGGSYADRLDKHGHLLYTVQFKDVSYPSDTQLMPNGNLLTVDYNTPGRVEIVNPKGKIVWEYYHASGPGELSNPSLAVRLPNGNIAVNDDYNDRVVVINPKLNKIVWQYGHKGVPGTQPDYLNIPDGMDLMPQDVQLPKP